MIPTDYIHPERLWALAAVPVLLIAYFLLSSARTRSTRRHVPGSLEILVRKQASWKRHIAVIASVLSLGSLVVAWATPNGYTEVPRDRATVIMVIDVSKSMEATDVSPSRLEAAQAAAKEFLELLPPRFNVSLVAFAGTAALLVPPTTDRGTVAASIDALQLAPSTAIGEGIYAGLDSLALVPPDPDHPDDPAPAAMVLLSDGESNLGRSSTTAAKDSKARGVPIYTIAYGTKDGYVIDSRGQKNPVPVNQAELQRVADLSGGQKFSATSADQLKQVYEGIAKSIGYEKVPAEITEKYAGVAALFGLFAALAAISLGARWP